MRRSAALALLTAFASTALAARVGAAPVSPVEARAAVPLVLAPIDEEPTTRTPAPPAAPVERRWYGWQILAIDAAAAACVYYVNNAICLMPYAFGGPIVHGLHGRWGRAGLSLGLRLALPPLSLLATLSLARCSLPFGDSDQRSCSGGELAIALLAGYGLAEPPP